MEIQAGLFVGVLYNDAIFFDLLLCLFLGFTAGVLWGIICRALKI